MKRRYAFAIALMYEHGDTTAVTGATGRWTLARGASRYETMEQIRRHVIDANKLPETTCIVFFTLERDKL